MNAYQQAAQRYENISRNWKQIIAAAAEIQRWANDEYVNAQRGLSEHETSPGIPLEQYRGADEIEDAAWPDGCPIPFDVAKAALQARLGDV